MINYFEYFGLPCQYSIDESLLRKLFYKKSMQVHPDQQESDDNHDEASVNNEAYRILSDKHLRLKHIVEIHTGTIDEHTEKLNPEFLMEMMDLHEEIENAESTEEVNILTTKINDLISSETESYNNAIQAFDEGNQSETVIFSLRELYFKEKYFRQMLQYLNREDREM